MHHLKTIEDLKANFLPTLHTNFNPEDWLSFDGIYYYRQNLLVRLELKAPRGSALTHLSLYYGGELMGTLPTPLQLNEVKAIPSKHILEEQELLKELDPIPSTNLIWWLSQKTLEIVIKYKDALPEYLISEIESMRGRAGRGRLWIHSQFPETMVNDTYFESPIGQWITLESMGGIVIRDEDAELVRKFPGLLTDLKLTRK